MRVGNDVDELLELLAAELEVNHRILRALTVKVYGPVTLPAPT